MRRWALAYGFALFAIAAAVVLRILLDPFLQERFPLMTLFVTVVLVGGNCRSRGPAVVAMIVGAVAAWYFLLEPRNSWSLKTEYFIAIGLYLVGCLVMIEVLQALRGAKLRAERKHADLVLEVEARREAERVLAEADRRKNEFLATLAHELRNPLAAIGNSLELMRHAGNPELVCQAQGMMDRQVRHLVRLVDDLMDVSRITRNKLRLQQSRLDLTTAIHQAVDLCRPYCETRKHNLVLRLPAKPVYVNADPVRIAQVFGNVLNNACKYTDPGGRIELSAETRDGHAVVRVVDSGIGVTPAMLPKVFELFTQADASIERADGGLGIGLSLVKRLVEMHGGTIALKSDGVGKGCDVRISLPMLPEQEHAEAESEPVTRGTPSAHRILVVDDNQDSADSLAALLRLSGNEVYVANDGAEAIVQATAHKPDIIMLDIGLPVMSGYDVCRRIRAERWGTGTTIVALTGWGQEEDRRKSREAGFDSHLVKPLEYDALLKILADVTLRNEKRHR